MLDYDDADETLLSFYDIPTLEPTSIGDINVKFQQQFDHDEINTLSTDEQFNLLNEFVHTNAGIIDNTTQYDYNGEDHNDPLTRKPKNVVKDLLDKGIISSIHDPNLNKFLISSQNFDSQQFLSVIHQDSSIDDLNVSLNFLQKSIENQTTELKSVIDENFIHFLSSKKAIDEVLVGLKNLKTNAQQERDRSKVFNPQRNKGNKNETLSSELEESINNLNMASSLMIRPVMEHKNKEIKLNKVVEFISKNKFLFDLPSNLIKYITTNNHDQFINDYNRFLKEKQTLIANQESRIKKLTTDSNPNTDLEQKRSIEVDQLISNSVLSKVFTEVDNIISEYRKKIYKELISMDHEVGLSDATTSSSKTSSSTASKFISLVDKSYQLDNQGFTTNPIYEFLMVQLDNLKRDLDYQNNKFDAKFTMMQRKLLDYIGSLADHREGGSYIRYINEKYNNIEDIFKTSSATMITPTNEDREKIIIETFESSDNLDLSIINETWLVFTNYINYLDELFLKNVSKFVNNYLHYANPKNNLNIDSNGKIRDSFIKLILDASQRLVKLFNNNENVDQRTSSPENFSHILPYHTNSLSTIFYLGDVSSKVNHWLTRIGEYTVIVGNSGKSVDTNKCVKLLREYSSVIDQQIVGAICAAWVNDCTQFYDLENWEKNIEEEFFNGGESSIEPISTKAMKVLEYYETFVLNKLSQIIFDRKIKNENKSQESVRIIASYPSKRILVSVEFQFLRSLEVLNDSMMKKFNLEKQKSLYIASTNPRYVDVNNDTENELYKVLTMNNFDVLSRIVFPKLIYRYDQLYDKNLLKQKLSLYAAIDKTAMEILRDFEKKEKGWIQDRILKHFTKLSNKNSDSIVLKVDSFIYEILIHFVKLIHIVKPLTGIEIFVKILNNLQTFFLNTFLSELRVIKSNENFKEYGNLKLDINFFIEVFEPSNSFRLNDYCMNLIEIIFKSLDENDHETYSDRQFQQVLHQSLKDSENEFIFKDN